MSLGRSPKPQPQPRRATPHLSLLRFGIAGLVSALAGGPDIFYDTGRLSPIGSQYGMAQVELVSLARRNHRRRLRSSRTPYCIALHVPEFSFSARRTHCARDARAVVVRVCVCGYRTSTPVSARVEADRDASCDVDLDAPRVSC